MQKRVRVPGSKSETNRALLLAALADGTSTISGALVSRDADLMVSALSKLGTEITGEETLTINPTKTFSTNTSIDCGLAGTVMRFVPPVAALAAGPTHFFGDARASERPIAPLLSVMNQLGAKTDATKLPFTIEPPRKWHDFAVIDASESSQFISGPLLTAARFPSGLTLRITGKVPSAPHIAMTVQMLRDRGVNITQPDDRTWQVSPGKIAALDTQITPDLTNAAVYLAAAMLTGGKVTIPGWPTKTDQPGVFFLDIAADMGAQIELSGNELTVIGSEKLKPITVDLSAASELTPVVATLGLFADGVTIISGVGHIRGHETDRLVALKDEFCAAGGEVVETADGLQITGGKKLSARQFNTYDDHRMAHSAALIGLKVPGTTLDDISCVSKTMPTFPQDWLKLCET
ncbi:MAG: 3-phosphoshikimate 1-carboxyvinyltransferase [Propionibacterium sp.]|nr:MAG: 3-phosphoshikimate 1-carboxyvinyltransferase [Propionibacterium sp.]